jgi:queuosine precursor transporter
MLALDKMYIVLCALFSILIVICNLTYQKFVYLPVLPFHTFELSVGAILYPFMFMLTDLIAEFYDKKRAKFCVRLAIAMNIVAALIVTGMDLLQATTWSKIDNVIFHKVFGLYGLGFIAIIFACYIAQIIDVTLYLWIKKLTKDKWLWLRNNGSTAISLFVDTFTAISCLTILGIFPKEQIWIIMLNSYSYKIFITICNTPLFYLLVGIIKKFIVPKKLLNIESELNTA